jgi:hypothetical protein
MGLIVDAHVGGENMASACSSREQSRLRGEITVTMQHENVRVSVIWRDYCDVLI